MCSSKGIASLFQEQSPMQFNLQASIKYNPRMRSLEKQLKFKIQVFIYSNEKDVARIFVFHFNKMFLSKVQQSYWYIQFCTEKNLYLILNILVNWNLGFIRSLNAS